MKTITTARTVIRPWYLSDADDFFEYASTPDVGPNAGWEPHRTRADSVNVIKNYFQRTYYHWAIVLPDLDKVIGGIGLTQDPKRSFPQAKALGYSMSKAFWGHGYMTEAAQAVISYGFKDLNAQLISAYHYSFNERSRRVIEKCGFTYEGKLRLCSQPYMGVLHDDCCYSMTREEFNKLYL